MFRVVFVEVFGTLVCNKVVGITIITSETKSSRNSSIDHFVIDTSICLVSIFATKDATKRIYETVSFLADHHVCFDIWLYVFTGVCNKVVVSGRLKISPYFYRHKIN